MRNLVEIFNSNDLRWLLDVKVLPDDYDTDYLIPVLDDIIFEYEELTGDKFYSNFMRKSDISSKDAAKIVVLRSCITLIGCGEIDKAAGFLLDIKSKSRDLEQLDREYKLLTQNMQVRAMKDSGKPKEKQSFGEMCAFISKQLEGVSIKDVRESTVAEFIGYKKIIKLNEKNEKQSRKAS